MIALINLQLARWILVPDDAEIRSLFTGDHVEISVSVQIEQFDAIELHAFRAADFMILPT